MISDKTIDYVSILAELELSVEEKQAAKKDMSRMLLYIDRLNELDTEGVEPMSHVFPLNNVFREDVAANEYERGSILANAPEQKDGAFKVPKTIPSGASRNAGPWGAGGQLEQQAARQGIE